MKLNTILKYTLILGLPVVGMIGCTSSGDNPGIEFAPQMYISDGYEPFSQAEEAEYAYNPNGMTMRLPVNGTVARGQLNYIYPYANDGSGYEASAAYTSWVPRTEENVAEGERLYNIYCWHCHGKKGKNDGPIFKSKKIPGPAWSAYSDPSMQALPEGKMYHVVTFGKGLMGPHGAMLDPDERWKVIHYVKKLSFGDAFTYSNEVASAEEVAEEVNQTEEEL